jgi:RNA polymerase sigma-B factor
VPADSTAGLVTRAAAGDLDAREQLVQRLSPMVAALARRFTGTASQADLEQAGMIGVLTAMEGFDPDRGTSFEAYASPFVIGELARCARDSVSGVRVPRSVRADERDVDRAVEAFTAAHGRTPSISELARGSGLDAERVVEALRARSVRRPVAMTAVSDEDLAVDDPDLDAVEERLELGTRLAGLDPRLRRILALRVGYGLSQREIGERVGMSQMHVSRLLRAALEQLGAGE